MAESFQRALQNTLKDPSPAERRPWRPYYGITKKIGRRASSTVSVIDPGYSPSHPSSTNANP